MSETSIDATWDRVATALAAAEPDDREHWAARFRDALAAFRFLPGGRIMAGAGTGRRVTLINCFVMGTLDDSLEGFSTRFARPRHDAARRRYRYGFLHLATRRRDADATGGHASGPVSFMHLWDQMCATVTDAVRGAAQ